MTPYPRRAVLGGIAAIGGLDAVAGPTHATNEADDGDGEPIEVFLEDRGMPLAYSTEELRNALMDGGPPPDGIPSIDDPSFVEPAEAPDTLDDGDPIFGVVMDGEAVAYPQYILVWHEIVNHDIGGTPVCITYCPLTGTAQGFYRGDLEFGVSGMLVNSNLVMFDRETDSLFPQVLAWGIEGEFEEEFLNEFRIVWTTWERWREQYPETKLLSESTGFPRNYGADPYGRYNPVGGYYESERLLFPALSDDGTLHPKEMVLGARVEEGALAVQKTVLAEENIIEETVDHRRFVFVYDPALDSGWCYVPADEVEVEYEEGEYVVDGESGYAADELPFDEVLVMDAMWFAWAGYYPEAELLHDVDAPFSEGDDDEETDDSVADEPDNDERDEQTSEENDDTPDEDDEDEGPTDDTDDREQVTTEITDGQEETGAEALPGFGPVAAAGGISAGAYAAYRLDLLSTSSDDEK